MVNAISNRFTGVHAALANAIQPRPAGLPVVQLSGLKHDTVSFGSTDSTTPTPTPSITDQAKALLDSQKLPYARTIADVLSVAELANPAVHDKAVDLLFADSSEAARWQQGCLFSFAMVEPNNPVESKRRINYAINKGLKSPDAEVYHAAALSFVKTSASSAYTGYEPAAVPAMVLRLLKDDQFRPGEQRRYKSDYQYLGNIERQLWPEPKQTPDFQDDPAEIAKFPFNARFVVQNLMKTLYKDRSDGYSPEKPFPQQIDAQRNLEAAVLGSDDPTLKKLFLAKLPDKEFDRVIATSAQQAQTEAAFINQANDIVNQLLADKTAARLTLAALPDEALFRSVVTRVFDSTHPNAERMQFSMASLLRSEEIQTLKAKNADSDRVKERIRFIGRLAEASPLANISEMGRVVMGLDERDEWTK